MARVFINHVDQYSGRVISKLFSQALVRGTATELEDEDDGDEIDLPTPSKSTYTAVGTMKDSALAKPKFVTEIIECSTRDELLASLLQCDVVIYDICEDADQVDEAAWAVEALHGAMEKYSEQKVFICLSTVMTWARTKPLDPEDPEIPFTEEDYRKRRSHPNFKDQVAVEKLVIKLGKTNKDKLNTYVVASGLTYGCGEDIFHFFFKTAWHGVVPALPVFGNGQNIVPTIHIRDLASVLLNVADARPATRYLVAVDGGQQTTLEEIVKTISEFLGNGKVKSIPKDDALLYKELQQKDYDRLLINVRIEATSVKDSMQIDWVAETGFLENIDKAIREYKETRGLLPVRVCILGPPQVGKSLVAAQICKLYKLHHVNVKDVINEEIRRLEESAARANADDIDEDDDAVAQKDSEYLDVLRDSKESNNGRYEDQHVSSFFRKKLKSMPCQNQGFVLDGYPKTYDQARELFAADEEEDEGQDPAAEFDKTIMPEIVISLEATDEFLRNRVMHLPELAVSETHNMEEEFLRRLSLYRSLNAEDTTVLNYFDELEVHPDYIDIEPDKTPTMKTTVDAVRKLIGEPRNYGPTPEEKAEMDRIAQEERLRLEAQAHEERERQEAEEAAETAQRRGEWRSQLEDVKHEEQGVLEAASVPLRNYLLQHVMPTLTQGLIEVCKIRPDDPIDYLAEYLFENNPQID